MNKEQQKEIISQFSPNLFWDVDMSQMDLDVYAEHVIQRVLEYGHMRDWRIIRAYYGLDKIVECCRAMRTLDPRVLSFICCISNTSKESYRCYNFAQSHPTPWNSCYPWIHDAVDSCTDLPASGKQAPKVRQTTDGGATPGIESSAIPKP